MRFLEVETHLDFFGGWGLCGGGVFIQLPWELFRPLTFLHFIV